MKKLAIAALLLTVVASAAWANHGGSFPLPLKHSEIAAEAEGLRGDIGDFCVPGDPMYVVDFALAGYHWRMLYVPKTGIGMFIQYTVSNLDRPVRVWIFTGGEDDVNIVRHVEDPIKAFPDGPCGILYQR